MRRVGGGLAWALTVLSVAFMSYASWLMQPQRFASGQDDFTQGAFYVALGIVSLGMGLGFWRWLGVGGIGLHGLWRDGRPAPPPQSPVRWRWLLMGLLLVAIVTQMNTLDLKDIHLGDFWRGLAATHPYVQGILLGLGWGMALWALIGRGGMGWRWRWHRTHGWLALIVGVGFVLRAWNLELWVTRFLDEIHYMHAIARIWDADGVQILMPFSQVTAFSWWYPLGQSLSASILGANFTGVRFLSVLSGTAQIVAVYWLGRAMLPRRTALLGALILATLPPHIHFSKIGINNIADPLFGLLALGYLVRGLRGGGMRHFVLAGAMLGLTHYFYEGGRLFFTPFVMLWLVWLLFIGRRHDSALRYLDGAYLQRMGFAFLVVVAPMYIAWVSQGISLTPRFEMMGDLRQPSILLDDSLPLHERLFIATEKLPLPARGLVQIADTSWFYSGEQALILWMIAPLLFLGMAHVFWRWRTVGGSLLFWWLTAVLVANSFIADSNATPRYLVGMGALALLIAIGTTHTLTLMLALLRRTGLRRWLLRLCMVGAGLTIGLTQGIYYYGVHLPTYYENTFYDFFDHRTGRRLPDTNDAILRAMSVPPHTDVHIVTPNLIWTLDMDSARMYYGRMDITLHHVFPQEFNAEYLLSLSTFRNQAFFLQPHDGFSFALIQQFFALDANQLGLMSPYRIPHDSQLYFYFAPATYQLREHVGWE